MKKLSKTQTELLSAMKSGVRVVYMDYMGWFNPKAYYYRADTHKKCTAEATALIGAGLAKAANRTASGHELELVTQTD